jgi:DNA-directed RNA polymerase subunit RPC12/RpoP
MKQSMNRETLCEQCQQKFHDDDAELHPILDAIICPYCGMVNLFVLTEPHSWESDQEALLDEQREAHHHPEYDDFYLTYVE